MPVVYDHGVVHHAEPQDLVRWVQGSLYHTALTQHHIQNHHLQVHWYSIYSYIQGGSRGRSIMLHWPSITSSTTTYRYSTYFHIYKGGPGAALSCYTCPASHPAPPPTYFTGTVYSYIQGGPGAALSCYTGPASHPAPSIANQQRIGFKQSWARDNCLAPRHRQR